MRYAVFFRNLNLGRPRCPTRAQFEDAFIAAGATSAASFLSNGSLVFSVAGDRRARQVLASAREVMAQSCGLVEPAFLRRLPVLADLVAADPFASVDRSAVYECCVSFLSPGVVVEAPLPLRSTRGDVDLLRVIGDEVLSLSYKPGKSPGSPNALLERLLKQPVTTRSWSTVQRLVERFS